MREKLTNMRIEQTFCQAGNTHKTITEGLANTFQVAGNRSGREPLGDQLLSLSQIDKGIPGFVVLDGTIPQHQEFGNNKTARQNHLGNYQTLEQGSHLFIFILDALEK